MSGHWKKKTAWTAVAPNKQRKAGKRNKGRPTRVMVGKGDDETAGRYYNRMRTFCCTGRAPLLKVDKADGPSNDRCGEVGAISRMGKERNESRPDQ